MLWYRFLQYISIYINYNTNNLRKRINNVKDKGVCNLFCRRLFGEESPGQQILGVPQKGRLVNFTYDGQKIQGYEGEPIAAALKAAGILIHRYTKKEHTPRGIFCAIGRCTDCVMVVDGVPNVRTCVTPLKAGMKVQTQYGVSAEPFEEQKTGGQTR